MSPGEAGERFWYTGTRETKTKQGKAREGWEGGGNRRWSGRHETPGFCARSRVVSVSYVGRFLVMENRKTGAWISWQPCLSGRRRSGSYKPSNYASFCGVEDIFLRCGL